MVGFRRVVLVGSLALAALPALATSGGAGEARTAAARPAATSLAGDALLRALRRGGYVVYFRHAATDFSMEDTDTGVLSDCARQRNLDARGRADARAIGRAWRSLRLPVGRVLSSRYCRARDTARLAFGRAPATLDLTGLPSAATDAERRRRVLALRRLLSQRPVRGNTILVAHLFNIQEAAGISLEEGEAAVFEPRGRSRFRLVGRVIARGWLRLAPFATPTFSVREFPVPAGTHPHDVAPARDGGVWYTAQHTGRLGKLDPATGRTTEIPLGAGSAPHGVIVGPDGAPWITDSGLNAIVRVDPETNAVRRFALPASAPGANLNTATFDRRGILWFTGQAGFYGRLDPRTGRLRVFRAPRGFGPYGIATTPAGAVYYVSLAGSYLARINLRSGRATVLEPPTRAQGARRVWSDSRGRLWISEWDAGKLGRYDPATRRWREWRLPGRSPQPYAIYVDDRDVVWLTDFGANAFVRFDPRTSRFTTIRLPSAGAAVRQLLGRRGEVWGAESGADKLVVVRTSP